MPIKSVKLPVYASNRKEDSYEKYFMPLMRNALLIQRRVFSLSYDWILKSKEALLQFLNQGGKLKLLVSLSLSEKQRAVFNTDDTEAIEGILRKEIVEPFKRDIPYYETWLVGYLSHLIVSGLLEIKISLPASGRRPHDELTFLAEDEDTVCFHGTFFPTPVTPESVNVFVSWDQRDQLRIRDYRSEFDKEWKNRDDDLLTLALPEALKEEFRQLKNAYNPFAYLLENKARYKLRSYQQEAIDALAANDWRGMLVMPPGSNHMLTSLFALDQFIVAKPRTVALIVSPNLHALSQWITLCRQKYPGKQLLTFATEEEVKDPDFTETLRLKLREDFIIIFATYRMFATQTFQLVFARNKNTSFYVFEECALITQYEAMMTNYPLMEGAALGLSGTPIEWLKDDRRNYLKKLFGAVISEYPLKNAIGKTHSEYEYITFLSEMIIAEYSEYKQFTSLMLRLAGEKLEEGRKQEKLREYQTSRETVIEKAYNKKVDFLYQLPRLEKKRIIVYVERSQIKDLKQSLEFQFKLSVGALSPDTPLEDRMLLAKKFTAGVLDCIVTCEAFVEGFEDLLPKAIYLLSSPTSPRIFFTRRGLLLLPQEGKYMPKIYDFVTKIGRASCRERV